MKTLKKIFALMLSLALVCGAALAEESGAEWHLFDTIAELTECEVPASAARIMQRDLYKETVNNVEITILEAGYDGRSLFLCYSFRMLDVDEPLGATAADVYGDDLPEGMDPEMYIDGYVGNDGEELLYNHNVGWWIDEIWINGVPLDDMPEGSGQFVTGTGVNGELLETDFWRIDQVDVFLEGKVQISLPIGDMQDYTEYYETHPERDGIPEAGIVTFEYDATGILDTLRVAHPEQETVLPEVTATVREAVFSPVMTYVTLDLEVSEEAMEAFIAENGEAILDDDGEVIWYYSAMDVFDAWATDLTLTDGDGNVLFPGFSGPDVLGDEFASFLCPCLETVPGTLYLAPVTDGKADISRAVRLLPEE